MIWKEIVGQELYVFFNGRLIYKKWLSTGASLVFDYVWGGFAWSPKALESIYAKRRAERRGNPEH